MKISEKDKKKYNEMMHARMRRHERVMHSSVKVLNECFLFGKTTLTLEDIKKIREGMITQDKLSPNKEGESDE